MDVGFYLGELLMQQGEVSVPGLGRFAQTRMSGYYDENEGKFYPPYHQAQFNPQLADDNALVEYIAAKKNISVESAGYFAERYIDNLKQQALTEDVPVGNLGAFYTQQEQLIFKPAAKITDDARFYGLEPVSLNKSSQAQAFVQTPRVNEEPVAASVPSYEAQPQNEPSPEFFEPEEEETTSRGPLRAILFTLLGIIVAGLGVFGLYRYQPDTFAKMAFWQDNQPAVKPKPAAKPADIPKLDTNKVTLSDVAPKDTAQAIATQPNDTAATQDKAVDKKGIVVSPAPVNPTATPLPASPKKENNTSLIARPSVAVGTHRFEVNVFTTSSIAEANTMTRQLRRAGLHPRIITDAPDQQIHISIGHFATKDEAKNMAITEVNAGHIPHGEAYALEIQKKETAVARPAVTSSAPGTPVNYGLVAALPSEAVGTHRFEVFATRGTNSVAEANALVNQLRKAGLRPRVVTDAPDQLIHISIGHFATKDEAKNMAAREINANHIRHGDAYAFEIQKKEYTASQPVKTNTIPAVTRPDFASLIAKPSDAVGTRRVEVYAFTTGSVAEANAAIKKMRKSGLDPRVVTDAPGTLIHISIGHFATKDEARNLAVKEIQAGHIPGGYAYGFEIIPTK